MDMTLERIPVDTKDSDLAAVFAIFARDACTAAVYAPMTTAGIRMRSMASYVQDNVTKCESIEDGLLAEGLMAASLTLVTRGQDVSHHVPTSEAVARMKIAAQGILDANTTSHIALYATYPELASEVMNVIQIEHPFMRQATDVAAVLLSDIIDSQLFGDKQILNATSWGFVGIFIFVVLVFYYPSVWSLGMPLRSARYLISLLPSELVSALPDLQALLRDVATEAQLMTRTGDASRH